MLAVMLTFWTSQLKISSRQFLLVVITTVMRKTILLEWQCEAISKKFKVTNGCLQCKNISKMQTAAH